jgi:murein DD-endopeptidase MepM/ murein hydrolase activator NlpD
MRPSALLALLLAASIEAKEPAFRVDVLSRAIAPGEPLRIVVSGTVPLARVEGSLDGASLAFSPDSPDSRRASAWAAVPLDRAPGPLPLEVRAAGHEPLRKTLVVAAKSFPEQRLTVEEKYVKPSKEAEDRIANERRVLDAVYARRSVRPPLAAPFARPVPGDPTSAFGLRRFFNDEPRAPHAGLDLRAPTGTKVNASGPGEVAFAGDLYFSGKTVILDHGGGLFTIYAHLSRIDVAEGDEVRRGAPVGLSGATGRVTGPHLHWGTRVGSTVVDPRALLDPVLFPEIRSGR